MSIANEIVEYENYGIIPFGSDSPYVLYQNALTDAASITADGWTTKTNTLIDTSGVSLTAATNGGLTIAGTGLFSAAQKADLRFCGQVSITVPTQFVGVNDSTANGCNGIDRAALSQEYFLGWDDASSRYGGFSMGSNNTLLAYIHSAVSPQNAFFVNTLDKSDECVLTLSWNNGDTLLYIDGKPVRKPVASAYGYHDDTIEDVFKNIRVGSRFGSGLWMTQGAVKNLIFSSQPVTYPVNHGLSKGITFFGHSFVDDASAVGGAAYTNEEFYRGEANMPQCLEREFIKRGYRCNATQLVGLGGGYVSDAAGTDLSTVTATAAATDPDWFICIMGTNDCLNIGLITDFESELDARIGEIMTATSNMVLHTIPTVKTNTTYNTAGNVAEVAEKNTIINGAPARWEAAKSAGQGSVFIADSFASFGGESPLSLMFNGQTKGDNSDIHPSGKGYNQFAVDAARIIIANIGLLD